MIREAVKGDEGTVRGIDGVRNCGAVMLQAEQGFAEIVAHGRQRLLLKNGAVVVQTNVNAYMPDAAHLDEAFSAGVKTTILFLASESARKAYRAIGFEEVAAYQIMLFGGDA